MQGSTVYRKLRELQVVGVAALPKSGMASRRPQLVFALLTLIASATGKLPRSQPLSHNEHAFAPVSSLEKHCKEKWFTTQLDHFSRTTGPNGTAEFPLRYFECSKHHRRAKKHRPAGPIFFYLGNESDVLLYLRATGLMWENAKHFHATLIFAEHRYYGKSLPFGHKSYKNMQWLSTEQALADYVDLIYYLKSLEHYRDAAVIGFGGSYGGMLAAWARLKYPHVWQGVIAASAPIWAFKGESPPVDPLFFGKGVTYDATPAAGATKGCDEAIRASWDALTKIAGFATGPQLLNEVLRICPENLLNSTEDVLGFRDWARSAFDTMAMGNYPYKSGYLVDDVGKLPPYPMKIACDKMMAKVEPKGGCGDGMHDELRLSTVGADELVHKHRRSTVGCGALTLLEGLVEAISVYYNYTETVECYNPLQSVNEQEQLVGDLWDYQFCTEMFMPTATNGADDMFWQSAWNEDAEIDECKSTWNVSPRPMWATEEWAGKDLSALTNAVFSNGLYDPWHGGGVLKDLSDSVKAVIIPEGAHHLDLMFSHKHDPKSVKEARATELAEIRKWIKQYNKSMGY